MIVLEMQVRNPANYLETWALDLSSVRSVCQRSYTIIIYYTQDDYMELNYESEEKAKEIYKEFLEAWKQTWNPE